MSDPQFRQEFSAILAKFKTKSANEVFFEAMDCLRKWNFTYLLQLEPKYVLTHPVNRGGLMLSPYNAHRNAATIHRVGADRKQLLNAVAMEMAPDGTEARKKQLAANESLIKRANGLLADINGSERVLSVGCGHTAAVCKHAGVGGKTSEPVLQDYAGKLDVEKIKRNSEFKVMIEEGWRWEVVKAKIDEDFPLFAKIAQKALNVSNNVGSVVSELEACVTLADFCNEPGVRGQEHWESMSIQNLEDLCIPCAPYAQTLLDFVKLYSGGQGAPHIHFMDNFAKKINCNVFRG